MQNPIITLTTDFGVKDPYVAEMKGVILCISPNATIIDITHEIEKYNIKMGAYILASAAQYFPKGTIHVAVIDPGVGTKRRPLLIQTRDNYYIGPDNGVLSLAAKREGIKHVYELTNRSLLMRKISNTFHGRDVFAPAAAHLANGTPPSMFGLEIYNIKIPKFSKVVRRNNMMIGEVLHVDDFGNIITNFGIKDIKAIKAKNMVNIKIKDARLKLKLCRTYGEIEKNKPLALVGSHNFLEISINQGNAAEKFRIKPGDEITLYRF